MNVKKASFKYLALAGAAALCLALSCALIGCSGSSDAPASDNSDGSYTLVQEGKLTVAASLDFPPFENLVDGKAEGFEVDLMAAIAEKMGLELNYLPTMKFDTIIPAIAAGGTADVGVSGFTITPARAAEIDFTQPVCDTNQAIVVAADSTVASTADLDGLRIGAETGTTGLDWARENIPGATEIVAFDEYPAVFAALQSGQVGAVVLDKPVADYYIKIAYGDCRVVEEVPTGEQYGIVVSKENPKLTEAIDKAIDELKADGTFAQIQEKWFGTQA